MVEDGAEGRNRERNLGFWVFDDWFEGCLELSSSVTLQCYNVGSYSMFKCFVAV